MKEPNPIEIKRGQKTVDRIQAHIAKRKASAKPTKVTAGSPLSDVDVQQQTSESTSHLDARAE